MQTTLNALPKPTRVTITFKDGRQSILNIAEVEGTKPAGDGSAAAALEPAPGSAPAVPAAAPAAPEPAVVVASDTAAPEPAVAVAVAAAVPEPAVVPEPMSAAAAPVAAAPETVVAVAAAPAAPEPEVAVVAFSAAPEPAVAGEAAASEPALAEAAPAALEPVAALPGAAELATKSAAAECVAAVLFDPRFTMLGGCNGVAAAPEPAVVETVTAAAPEPAVAVVAAPEPAVAAAAAQTSAGVEKEVFLHSEGHNGTTFKITIVAREAYAASFDGAAMTNWVADVLAATVAKNAVRGWWRLAWYHSTVERRYLVIAAMFSKSFPRDVAKLAAADIKVELRAAVTPAMLLELNVVTVTAEPDWYFAEVAARVAASEHASTARLTRTLGTIQRRVCNAPVFTTNSGGSANCFVISVVFGSSPSSDNLRDTATWIGKSFATKYAHYGDDVGKQQWVWLDERLAPNCVSFLVRLPQKTLSVPALFRSSGYAFTSCSFTDAIRDEFTTTDTTPLCIREARAAGVAALYDQDFEDLYERAIESCADRADARANGWL